MVGGFVSVCSRLGREIHGQVPHCWGSAGGSCPHLAPPCFPQLHIVHINVKYRTLAEAKGHPNGLAVLGFFFQVGLWVLMLPVEWTPWEQVGRSVHGCPQGTRRGREAGSRPGGAREDQW